VWVGISNSPSLLVVCELESELLDVLCPKLRILSVSAEDSSSPLRVLLMLMESESDDPEMEQLVAIVSYDGIDERSCVPISNGGVTYAGGSAA